MWTDSTLTPIADDDQYRAPNGTLYPSNFPKASISGLHAVTLTTQPSDPSLVITGFTIDGTYTQMWQTRAISAAEIAAASAGNIPVITDSANSLLRQKAKRLTAAGDTAGALNILLNLQ